MSVQEVLIRAACYAYMVAFVIAASGPDGKETPN